ncbi:unnamed protein product [Effrenium voratum]|uniref:Uncharacterized protein n=1 Tax=Effrenium voratum TaxID=2562239 RepID=A0AA36N4P5_9DINO|nr:unnamed protein product [Effrenium voratum]
MEPPDDCEFEKVTSIKVSATVNFEDEDEPLAHENRQKGSRRSRSSRRTTNSRDRQSEAGIGFVPAKLVSQSLPRGMLCINLVILCMLWCAFVAAQAAHQDVPANFEIREAFRNIHDGGLLLSPTEVRNFEDFYAWMRQAYLPSLLEAPPGKRPGLVAGKFRLVGGVRLQHRQRKLISCIHRGRLADLYNHTCLAPAEETSDESDTFWLDVNLNSSLEHVQRLEDSRWLNHTTSQVGVQAFYFNAKANIFVLTAINFRLRETGAWQVRDDLWTIPVNLYGPGGSAAAADITVLVIFVMFVCGEAWQFRHAYQAAFIKPYLFSVFRFAMVLVVFGAVSFFIASVSLDAAINRLVGKLQNLVGMEAPYRTLDEIHELAMNIALQDRWMQWLNFWYMMMLLVKCGEDLPVSPRLMVFVHTLREASGSIFYFVIFFFIVFSNFAMGAHFLFGHILYEWSADALPFVSTFRVLMGDFDFMAMYAIAPVSSMIWFSLFAVFVYLILVNLFISIVSESYYTVYNSVMLTNEEDVIQKYASNISSSISSALSRPRMLSYASFVAPLKKLHKWMIEPAGELYLRNDYFFEEEEPQEAEGEQENAPARDPSAMVTGAAAVQHSARNTGASNSLPARSSGPAMPASLLCCTGNVLVTFCVWAAFVWSQVVHHSTSETYEARKTFVNLQSRAGVSSIAGKGNKVAVSQNQIQNFGSFYSWIRETMLPALFNEGPYGRSLIAGKARVIGGVRLRQICHAPAACPDTRDFLVELYNETCYADKAETKTYWLDNSHSLEVALEHLHHLEETEWLSMATNSFAAEAFYYNGQTRSFLITSAMWHVKDTGLWRLQNTLGAFPDDMYSSDNWISVADSFCIVSLVLFAVTEIVLLRFAAKAGVLKKHLLSVNRLAAFFTLLGGAIYVAYYFHLGSVVASIGDKLEDLPSIANSTAYLPGESHKGDWLDRHQTLDDIHEIAARVAMEHRAMQWLGFWFMMVLLLKLGDGLILSPRLMIYINTLHDASGSLFYFFLVFFFVFANFAVGAHFLFGHILYEWSHLVISFASAFRVLLGDFEFMAMYSIAPMSAIIWFTLFTIFVYLVLLNLFIAIISDSYFRVYHATLKMDEEDLLEMMAQKTTQLSNPTEVASRQPKSSAWWLSGLVALWLGDP